MRLVSNLKTRLPTLSKASLFSGGKIMLETIAIDRQKKRWVVFRQIKPMSEEFLRQSLGLAGGVTGRIIHQVKCSCSGPLHVGKHRLYERIQHQIGQVFGKFDGAEGCGQWTQRSVRLHKKGTSGVSLARALVQCREPVKLSAALKVRWLVEEKSRLTKCGDGERLRILLRYNTVVVHSKIVEKTIDDGNGSNVTDLAQWIPLRRHN